jgi:hypothetical protein
LRRVEVASRLATLAADRHDPRELATKPARNLAAAEHACRG